MAITVESVSSVATSTGNPLTITKPTGLAENNLLIAVLYAHNSTGLVNRSWVAPTGWSQAIGGIYGPFSGTAAMSILYKRASSADAAASNFDFSLNVTNSFSLRGYLIRASGNMITDEPLGASGLPYTPPADGALVIGQFLGYDNTVSDDATTSGYAATNVSFTEGDDHIVGDGTPAQIQASAYGIQSTAAEITSVTAVFSDTFNDGNATLQAIFLPPIDASASNTLTEATAEVFEQVGTSDVSGTNTLLTTTTETFTQSGQGRRSTTWTNETRPSTTWTNETV